MLREIYDYGLKTKITSPAGFKLKTIKAYLSLTASGEFVSVDAGPDEKNLCPDIGSMANGRDKCNILVEKADIVFAISDKGKLKHQFYISALQLGSEFDPLFAVCLSALQDENTMSAMRAAFFERKYKDGDVIGFKVDGIPLEQSPKYLDWWRAFRKELQPGRQNAKQSICFITGERDQAMQTVPKFSGLFAVGGHTSGDALICFDKAAFSSYNLEQAENCTVSEDAMTTINFTLERMLKDAPIIAGTKFLHWYKEPLPQDADYDLIGAAIEPVAAMEDDDDSCEPAQGILALQNANRLIESVKKGEYPTMLHNRYYILSLSGAGGRVMIRSYHEGSYLALYQNIRAWFDDLMLINAKFPPKLAGIYSRLLKYQKNAGNIGKRMSEELAGLDSRIVFAIVNNTPLPDSMAARALAYIRSDMLSSDEEKSGIKIPDRLACRMLKAWLIRKRTFENRVKKEDCSVKEGLNEANLNAAYLTGRLLAVYAKIQEDALGRVGAGVVQRFYTASSTSPGLVIGRLASLSQHHLAKLSDGANVYYSKILSSIYEKVQDGFPKTLNLEGQAEFALGYYQQLAELYKAKPKADQNNNEEDEL